MSQTYAITQARRLGAELHFEICPNWQDGCACPREVIEPGARASKGKPAAPPVFGELIQPHHEFAFGRLVDSDPDAAWTSQGWEPWCAAEALRMAIENDRLRAAEAAAATEPLSDLVGRTANG